VITTALDIAESGEVELQRGAQAIGIYGTVALQARQGLGWLPDYLNLKSTRRQACHHHTGKFMSYVQSVITPGETLIAQAKTHWFIYVGPACWVVVALILMVAVPPLGAVPLVLSIILFIRAWLYVYSTELAVTSKRVIAKFGFIRRNTIELRHEKVESFHVRQGIVGRIFDFGSIVIKGSGGTNAPIPYIASPLRFRSAALTGIESPAT